MCSAPTHTAQQTPTDCSLRGCPLTILRSLKQLLCLSGHSVRDLGSVLEELRFKKLGKNKNARVILGQRFLWGQVGLHAGEWLSDFISHFDRWYGYAGTLHNLLAWPVRKDQEFRLYSVLVHGLGRLGWSEWAMARVEWLAFEILDTSPRVY